MTKENNQPVTVQEEKLDMECEKETIGCCAAHGHEATDDEIEACAKEMLRLVRMGRASIEKIQQEGELACEIELEGIDDHPARLYALLSREIGLYDRYVMVYGNPDGAEPTLGSDELLIRARRALCSPTHRDIGLTQEEQKNLLHRLMALNEVYRCLTSDPIRILHTCEDMPQEDESDSLELAMDIIHVFDLYECGELPEEYAHLEKAEGDMKAKIAAVVCAHAVLYKKVALPMQMQEPRFEISGRTKKILLGTGAVGAAAMLILGPGSVLTKACAGVAAAVLGACLVSAME